MTHALLIKFFLLYKILKNLMIYLFINFSLSLSLSLSYVHSKIYKNLIGYIYLYSLYIFIQFI